MVYSPPRVAPQVLDLLWMVRLTVLCHPPWPHGDRHRTWPLVAANDLLHVKVEGRSQRFLWETFARTVGLSPAQVDRGLVFDTAQLAAQYALSGEGIALVDPVLFQDDIAAGRLARPLDIDVDDGYGYYLAIHPDDLDRPEIALFRTLADSPFLPPLRPARRAAKNTLIEISPERVSARPPTLHRRPAGRRSACSPATAP